VVKTPFTYAAVLSVWRKCLSYFRLPQDVVKQCQCGIGQVQSSVSGEAKVRFTRLFYHLRDVQLLEVEKKIQNACDFSETFHPRP